MSWITIRKKLLKSWALKDPRLLLPFYINGMCRGLLPCAHPFLFWKAEDKILCHVVFISSVVGCIMNFCIECWAIFSRGTACRAPTKL